MKENKLYHVVSCKNLPKSVEFTFLLSPCSDCMIHETYETKEEAKQAIQLLKDNGLNE